jgi:hypothetical protein
MLLRSFVIILQSCYKLPTAVIVTISTLKFDLAKWPRCRFLRNDLNTESV